MRSLNPTTKAVHAFCCVSHLNEKALRRRWRRRRRRVRRHNQTFLPKLICNLQTNSKKNDTLGSFTRVYQDKRPGSSLLGRVINKSCHLH